MATAGNDTIYVIEADIAALDALGGTDTLVARSAIKTLNMAVARAEVFRGSMVVG